MPILAASRAAAVRDETPILDRTAETWWCTVRSEMNSRREISRSGRPSESSARTFLLAGCQPRPGRGPRRRPGPARDRGHAELFHPPPGRRGNRPGAEAVQNGEGRPELGAVVGGNGPRQGSVVGPAEPFPGSGGAAPVPGDLQRVLPVPQAGRKPGKSPPAPSRHSQTASAPSFHGSAWPSACSQASCASARARSSWPDTHSSSARTARACASHCGETIPAASAAALSSSSASPGSPRRPRMVPRIRSG